MITIKRLQGTFSVFASGTLLLSIACLSSVSALAATLDFKPDEIVEMNEAAPPWAARPDALAGGSAESTTKQVPVAAETAKQPTAAAGSGSVMENWYRNRRQQAAKPSTAIQVIQTSAQRGDADAQYELGMLYQSGAGVPRDMAQARRWLTQSASQNNSRAQYALAMFYRSEEGGNDINQSLNWQRKAAQAGYAEAQYGLGLLYANGQYVTQDATQARIWFQKAADQGHVAANLALLEFGESAPVVAQAPLTLEDQPRTAGTGNKSAAGGSVVRVVVTKPEPAVLQLAPKAPIVVAAAPETVAAAEPQEAIAEPVEGAAGNPGPSGSVDLTGVETSVLRQSAEAGDQQAQLMMGTMYEDGVGGLSSDLREAAYWYEQAARQGYPKAQYNLGLLYEDGRGVKQNYKQAAYWYDKAAESGFSEAQNNLGVLLILGKGVKMDKKKAEALFSEAARNGNANAQRNLSMLRNG